MKIKRETISPGKDKASTVLPQYSLQTKTGAKKRRMCTIHDRTYRGSVQKSRVQPRSRTSSPTDFSDKQGKCIGGMDPATFTSARTEVLPEVTGEEEDTETGGEPPPEISGILPADACCK